MQNEDRAMEVRGPATHVRRFVGLLVAGTAAWLVVSFVEAAQLTDAGWGTWLGLLGVIGPVVFIATVGVGLVGWFLEPRSPWGLARLRGKVGGDHAFARRLALVVALTCWISLVAILTLGGVGLWGLAHEGSGRRA